MKNSWKQTICHGCGGFGIISDYGNGEDFYGPKECEFCSGSGNLWISPNNRLTIYPGGPFRGRLTKDELQISKNRTSG